MNIDELFDGSNAHELKECFADCLRTECPLFFECEMHWGKDNWE